ncbi:universal stress protein [Actinokineospora xionganensis]|uniref:universal stress protein n=1 Tax=Actinokineospora xionganensis TaxID=2684470 RepID=UPI0028AB5D43|nr:universal stress protein [Actinokineospora xionganensis]
MTIHDRTSPVLVGVDGSASAIAATRWAAAEAARRKVPLHIVNVYTWPISGYPEALIAGHDLLASMKKVSAGVLDEARAAAESAAPEVAVTVTSHGGDTVSHLRSLSKKASLLVVGSRGLGGFSGLLLGSVAVGLTAHAQCPVIVVRGEPEEGPVVVGVDGSPVSEAAIAFAFEEASALGADLVAVHAWHDSPLVDVFEKGYASLYLDTAAVNAEELLAQRLAGWQEKYPDVSVTRVAPRGRAAKVLMEHAKGARLLVIGSRGRGGLTGLTLGSTSQALIHHAPCPLALLRSPEDH